MQENEREPKYFTKQEVLQHFKISSGTLDNYRKQGFPVAGFNQYDIAKCSEWYIINIVGKTDNNNKYKAAEKAFWNAKADLSMIHASIKAGEYLLEKTVDIKIKDKFSVLLKGVQNLSSRFPLVVIGKSKKEIRSLLEGEVKFFLETFLAPIPGFPELDESFKKNAEKDIQKVVKHILSGGKIGWSKK